MEMGEQVTTPLTLSTDHLCCLVRGHLAGLGVDSNAATRPIHGASFAPEVCANFALRACAATGFAGRRRFFDWSPASANVPGSPPTPAAPDAPGRQSRPVALRARGPARGQNCPTGGAGLFPARPIVRRGPGTAVQCWDHSATGQQACRARRAPPTRSTAQGRPVIVLFALNGKELRHPGCHLGHPATPRTAVRHWNRRIRRQRGTSRCKCRVTPSTQAGCDIDGYFTNCAHPVYHRILSRSSPIRSRSLFSISRISEISGASPSQFSTRMASSSSCRPTTSAT